MLCFTTQFPCSRLLRRLHFIHSIPIRLCSHEWVLANWIHVGLKLILTFIIFWEILKLVVMVILTLPFPLSSYTIRRGVLGAAGIHSHSWLEECTISKHHHHPNSETEGPDNITTWCPCLMESQTKLDTYSIWENVLLVKVSYSSGCLLRFSEEKNTVNFCFQERAIIYYAISTCPHCIVRWVVFSPPKKQTSRRNLAWAFIKILYVQRT